MLPRLACLVAVILLAGCLDGGILDQGDRPSATDRVSRLLTNETDSRIAIRAYYVAGREPVPAAMDWLAGRLKELTGKVEVTVEPFVALSTGTDSRDTNWTAERADAVFNGLDIPSEPGTFQLVMIFLDGYGYNGYGKAAGWQDEQYLGVWPDTFRGAGLTEPMNLNIPVPDPDAKEDKRVMLHESGHMLGLVDHGAPMVQGHVDPSDPCLCHSANPDSVMYTGVDSVVDLVRHTLTARDFDADDLADLKAFQDAHVSSG